MNRRAFLARTAGGLVITGAAHAMAPKPNFSGTWKMVAEKSDFGAMPAPHHYQQKIEHNDPNLKISITQEGQGGDQTSDYTYHTGGKETSNASRGGTMKSKAKWDGETLVINSTLNIQGFDLPVVERYALADGMLTLTRKMTTPNGELNTKIAMSKAE